jgi:hypothetical protein
LAAVGTVAVVGAGLPGCAAEREAGTASGTATPDDSRDAGLARRAAGASVSLLVAYRETMRRHRDLRRVLAPLAAHHAEHLDLLATAGNFVPSPRVPGTRAAALRALRDQEVAVARSRRTGLVSAGSGDLARVLASVVACQAQHVVLLDRELR